MDTLKLLVPEIDVSLRNSRQKMNFSTDGSARLKKTKASRVPEQTRVYNHGDPTHLIDWKLYARTDQLLLREHKDQTSLQIGICLCYSETMNWPTRDIKNEFTSKWEIAFRVAFHLAYQHLNVGDRVKLYIRHNDIYHEIKLLSASSVLKLFNSMDGKYDVEKALSFFQPSNLSPSKLDKFYYVSDLIGKNNISDNDSFASLSVKHILSDLDLNLDWINSADFYSPESDKTEKVKGNALITGDFLSEEISDWLSGIKQRLDNSGSYYQLLTDTTPLDEYLSAISWEMTI